MNEMMLTFAFLVDRGSWTRSCLPSGGQSGPLLAPPAYFPSSPCTSEFHPGNQPNPTNLLLWLVIFVLDVPRRWPDVLLLPVHCPVQQSSMRPPFPRWRASGVA